MPETITRYRVFIASPSGLEAERRAFRETIRDYNEESDRSGRAVSFMPVGWEDTLGGVGRPQYLINRDIIPCDFFVLVLWDRWGSPPDTAKKSAYSSGCEEEFELALRCLRDSTMPMQQILIFFKSVEPRRLADPGPQLDKVLEFKRRIEAGKEHLFATFDETALFQKRLRLHLAAWLQDHEKGRSQKSPPSKGDRSDQ